MLDPQTQAHKVIAAEAVRVAGGDADILTPALDCLGLELQILTLGVAGILAALAALLHITRQFHANLYRFAVQLHQVLHHTSQFGQAARDDGVVRRPEDLFDRRKVVENFGLLDAVALVGGVLVLHAGF